MRVSRIVGLKRVDSGFKIAEWGNTHFLRSHRLKIPAKFNQDFPDRGIVLSLHHQTGFYRGNLPPMVTINLYRKDIPNNSYEKVETVAVDLDPFDHGAYADSGYHPRACEIISGLNFDGVLQSVLSDYATYRKTVL